MSDTIEVKWLKLTILGLVLGCMVFFITDVLFCWSDTCQRSEQKREERREYLEMRCTPYLKLTQGETPNECQVWIKNQVYNPFLQ